VNEGFGFAFLEPWTAGREVLGRRVPHVCRDFEAAGLRFPSLYHSLPVRIELFDVHSLAERWRRAVEDMYRRFGQQEDPAAAGRVWTHVMETGSCDFSFLDEEAQREVITRVLSDGKARKSVGDGFPALEAMRSSLDRPDEAVVAANGAIVRARYGEEEYARLLNGIYGEVLNIGVRHAIDRRKLLDRFLVPGALRLIEVR
jgi:hypothetical protein